MFVQHKKYGGTCTNMSQVYQIQLSCIRFTIHDIQKIFLTKNLTLPFEMFKSLIVITFVPMISQANLSCIITNFLNHFIVPKPLPILYNASKEKKISLAKSMNENGISLKWVNESISSEKFLLILHSDNGILIENIRINQQFYFLNKSMDIFEKYMVNNHMIEQKLGYVSNNSYFPMELVEQSFLRRRNNV